MRKFLCAFGYAFRGIYHALKRERHMRIHFVCMIYLYSFLLFFDFFRVSRTQFAILFLANAAVVAMELVNTAIERMVDLASGRRTEKGKVAKDAAAGAVLVSAIFAVAVGIAILWQSAAFSAMRAYFTVRPLRMAVFVTTLGVAMAFIWKGFSKGLPTATENEADLAYKEKE